ncbi:HEAT repeat domain-containing protein [Nocardiopsis dassonvillei]|uniref:HEAT repeat domain-containing protein n=1 Tax=Nocardiopsis dassonvillei TaxID=2014 RepID=UPI00200FED56|nr:HEAT repeat domain-containing protein [Nocardiopsis dassonvillei]MCK9872782.1 HEAT repeat domain-containing protein [Nocardiopsis dassonvillei]
MVSVGPDFTDWDSLRYANGKADIPAILADLGSGEPDRASKALNLLCCILTEIGPLYPETPDMVTALVAAVVDPHCPLRRDDLLYALLLAVSAGGQPALMERVRLALGAAVPELLTLLADPDTKVRESAVLALSWAHLEDPSPAVAALRERFASDGSATERGYAAVSLAALGCADREWITEALAPGNTDMVRVAAAWALARSPWPWTPQATRAIVEGAENGGSCSFTHLRDARRLLDGVACNLVPADADTGPDPGLELLRDLLASARPRAAVSFAESLSRTRPPVRAEAMRMVAEALPDSPEAHKFLKLWKYLDAMFRLTEGTAP